MSWQAHVTVPPSELAQVTCARQKMRVPSMAEAHLMGENIDIPGVIVSSDYWVDDLFNSGGNLVAALATEGDGFNGSADPTTEAGQVLCVTNVSQGG